MECVFTFTHSLVFCLFVSKYKEEKKSCSKDETSVNGAEKKIPRVSMTENRRWSRQHERSLRDAKKV